MFRDYIVMSGYMGRMERKRETTIMGYMGITLRPLDYLGLSGVRFGLGA